MVSTEGHTYGRRLHAEVLEHNVEPPTTDR